MRKHRVLVIAVSLLAVGCTSAVPSVDSLSDIVESAQDAIESSTIAPFSSDVLYDGVALLDSEFEARFGFEPMGSPVRGDNVALIPAEVVAPERCLELASLVATYGPVSVEPGFGQASFEEGNWGYITGTRTSPNYRQTLAESISGCDQFSYFFEAPKIYNGEVKFETSDFILTDIVSAEPDHIVLELEAYLNRQFVDIYEPGDCLRLVGPACMGYFGASYRLHMVSAGEYSLFFMIETWDAFESIPPLGVAVSDMDAIGQIARDYLEAST